ncbi:MAG: PAS domain S-box protein, partial [Candidatus Binatia bacterium]
GAPLKELLEYLIETMERYAAAGMRGSILLLDESGDHFRRGIGKRLPDAFNAAVEGVAVDSMIGVCSHAVRNREAIVVPDFEADPKWAAFAEFVAPFGLRAGWSSPIIGSDGKVLGTFANYYQEVCDPSPQDMRWVEIVRRTAAVAIERKRFEALSQRLALIVESSGDAIASMDRIGKITSWNPGAERLFGYSKEEVIGRPAQEVVPQISPTGEFDILHRLLNGEHVANYQAQRRRKDGRPVDVSITASPIKDEDGEIFGVAGIARDISEQKRAESLSSCQHHALEMLAEGAPLNDLLEFLINEAERHLDEGSLGSIVLLNGAGTHFERGIGSSLPDAFNAAVEGVAVDSLTGICCHAVRNRTPVVASDFASDPKWTAFAALA